MDENFWHQKWENNEIAFHGSEVNPLLVTHFKALSLVKGKRLFLPLCGKTLDIAWLLSNGYRVVGAELSKLAIAQLFTGLGLTPTISQINAVEHYSANNIDLFVGDIFHLSRDMLGQVEAVYDRAALVALPEEMRKRYTAHLMEITHTAPQLLISYVYDQTQMDGPPFSVSNEEINQHYRDAYDLNLLASANLPEGMKGKCAAIENVWLLSKKS